MPKSDPQNSDLQSKIEKEYQQRDKKIAKAKMKVTGKGNFTLQKLIAKPHAGLSQRKNSKKRK